MLSLRDKSGFQPYRGPAGSPDVRAPDGVGRKGHDAGDWNVFYLYLHNMEFHHNCALLPVTVQLIQRALPRHFHHAFVSFLAPGTHIPPHHGPTNKKLRFHLPICGVKGARLRVGETIHALREGEGYVFDDSFEHEAWHDGPLTRVVLIADFWHPDLTDAEIKLLNALQNSRLRGEHRLIDSHPDRDNFFRIIEDAQSLITDNDWWV